MHPIETREVTQAPQQMQQQQVKETAAVDTSSSSGSGSFDIFLVLIAVFSVLNIGLIIAVIILGRARKQSALAKTANLHQHRQSGRSVGLGSIFEDSPITQREERISWKLEKYFREPKQIKTTFNE